jgi:hypothetical protein
MRFLFGRQAETYPLCELFDGEATIARVLLLPGCSFGLGDLTEYGIAALHCQVHIGRHAAHICVVTKCSHYIAQGFNRGHRYPPQL